MPTPKPTLEQLLLEHGLLKPRQLDRVQQRAKAQNKTAEQIIREEKLVYPEPLAQIKAELLGVPYIDLNSVNLDEKAMQDISARAAATYRFVAFAIKNDRLLVAMESPDNYQALEAIRFIAKKNGLTPEIYCASSEGIDRALSIPPLEQASQVLRDFGKEFKKVDELPKDQEKLRQALEQAPINKVVAVIIRHAIDGLASDIHIEPGAKELRVRYRIDGKLHTSLILPP